MAEMPHLDEVERSLGEKNGPATAAHTPCVFVIGCPRSGTSVLSWALAQQHDFWTSAESDFMLDLFGKGKLKADYERAYARPDRGWLSKNEVGYEEFAACLGSGVDKLFLSRSGGKRWVDATPGYTLMAHELALLFPAAKFLNIVRNGRAVVNSMVNSHFSAPWASDFAHACETWVHYVLKGCRFQSENPDRALEVRYEALVDNAGAQFEEIWAFLEADPSPKAAELIDTKRINSSYGNVEPGDIRKIKDPKAGPKEPWTVWGLDQIATFRRIAGPMMVELGYPDE